MCQFGNCLFLAARLHCVYKKKVYVKCVKVFFFFLESFNLWRPLLIIFFTIRSRHQLIFGVSRD